MVTCEMVATEQEVLAKYGYGEVLQTLMDKATYQKSVSSPVILRLCGTIKEGLIADTQKIGRLKGDLEKIQRTVIDHENLKKKQTNLKEEYSILNQKHKKYKAEMQLANNQWKEDKHFLEEEIRTLREERDNLQGMVDDMTSSKYQHRSTKKVHRSQAWE